MESGQGIILAGVVSEMNRVRRSTQDTRLIEAEFKKAAERPPVIALGNDQVKSTDHTEALSARFEPLAIVSEKYRVVFNERLNDAIDGYLVGRKCTQTLIDIIFNDLRPTTKQPFQGPL